jgi:hypothetical protein
MSSLFTDTIRKTGGSLGTDIRIKNTSVYESDGGTSVTKNLVQSLTKAWAGMASDATPEDSLNISSGDDDGTGNYGLNFTSNMSNANYSSVNTAEFSHNGSSQNPRYTVTNSRTTSSVEIDGSYINSSSVFIFYDFGDIGVQVSGDLA